MQPNKSQYVYMHQLLLKLFKYVMKMLKTPGGELGTVHVNESFNSLGGLFSFFFFIPVNDGVHEAEADRSPNER